MTIPWRRTCSAGTSPPTGRMRSGSRTSPRYCRRIRAAIGAAGEGVVHEPASRTDRRDPRRDRARRPRRLPQGHRGHAAARRVQRPLRGRGLPPALSRPGPTRARAVAAGAGHGLPVPRAPQRPASRRRGARPHRLEVRARARADRSGVPLQRAGRVPGPPRRGRGGAPAARPDARALQGARPGKARGKQRTDSTHVLAAVHDLHLLELVTETLRAALDDLAAIVPDWLRTIARPDWFERYRRRVEDYRLPKGRAEREALALAVGADGFALLDALDAPEAPAAAREVPMVGTLRDVWRVHYARGEDGRPRWRAGGELPPVGERLQSPYDPEAHYSTKRQMEWSGYKVHVTETCDEDAAHLVTDVLT